MDHDSSAPSPSPADAADTGDPGDDQATHRYDREVDPLSDTTHGHVVRLVGRDRRVLELGPATGHMTAVLSKRGCTVVGIERDARMAEEAACYSDRMIVGDLDELDMKEVLGQERFDVIVAADVLEHLRDPSTTLRRLRPFLAPGGSFVLSLPNIAHGSVRLALLEGHFDYRETGLLDRTHLRFFTREGIERLLDDAELAVADLHRQALPVDAAEVTFDPAGVPAGVRELLGRDPEAETYQFVVRAVPLPADGLREIQRRMRAQAEELAELRRQRDEAHEQERRLSGALDAETGRADALQARSDQLREALVDAHDEMLRRDETVARLLGESRRLRGQLGAASEEQTRLRVRLERILGSPPARAYSALSSFPGLRTLKAARTAGYDTAVRHAQEGRQHG